MVNELVQRIAAKYN